MSPPAISGEAVPSLTGDSALPLVRLRGSLPRNERLTWELPGHGEALPECGKWTYRAHFVNGPGSEAHYRGWRYKCGRFECPECDGWIKREAGAIANRIARSSTFGAWIRSDAEYDEATGKWETPDYTPAPYEEPACVACWGRWRPGSPRPRCPHLSDEDRRRSRELHADLVESFSPPLTWRRWAESAPADRVHLPVHVVLSPPMDLWSEIRTVGGYVALRNRAYKVARSRGLRGGCLVFHHARLRSSRWDYNRGRFSEGEFDCPCEGPHFHAVGFGWITGTSAGYRLDGWVVKNLGTRRSVYQTALYLLSHTSRGTPESGYPAVHRPDEARPERKRGPEVVTWFGDLSYRAKWLREPPGGSGIPCYVCDEEGNVAFPANEWHGAAPTFVPPWEGAGPPPLSTGSAEGAEVHGECRPGEWRITVYDETGGWGRDSRVIELEIGAGGGVATCPNDLERRVDQATRWLRIVGRDHEADELEAQLRAGRLGGQ